MTAAEPSGSHRACIRDNRDCLFGQESIVQTLSNCRNSRSQDFDEDHLEYKESLKVGEAPFGSVLTSRCCWSYYHKGYYLREETSGSRRRIRGVRRDVVIVPSSTWRQIVWHWWLVFVGVLLTGHLVHHALAAALLAVWNRITGRECQRGRV